MYLAEAALSMTISMTLAVFEITNVVENGVPVAPKHENTSGTIRCVFLSFTHTLTHAWRRWNQQLSGSLQMRY